MDFGVVLQTNPPAWRTVAPRQAGRGARVRLRVDLRLPPAVAGAVRHLLGRSWPRRSGSSSARWSPTRPPATGRSRRRSSRPSTRCTATAPCAASAAATRRCGCSTGRRATLKEVREATHVIRELANCRPVEYKGSTLQFPWARTSELEVWVAAYGPLALKTAGEVGDGFILQLADVDIAAWMIGAVREAAEKAGRDPRRDHLLRRGPDVRRGGLAQAGPTCASSAAGSAAWSATTSPTSWPSTATPGTVPAGAHRLHQGSAGLRLQRARTGRQHPHRVRARRDRRAVLRPRHSRGAHRQARRRSRPSGSTSSRVISSTTTRRRPCGSTARRSCRCCVTT